MRKCGDWRRLTILLLVAAAFPAWAQSQFTGFDRNDYPGDAALPALHAEFRFAGYWLNAPPGEKTNWWAGKRTILKQNGFGFLVLFNGRGDADLKSKDAAQAGAADGKAAVAAAMREGFPRGVRIFLDQEEGGRLLPEQVAYIFAWIDAVRAAGARAGVYCSGIAVGDASGETSTAEDIAQRESARTKDSSRGNAAEQLALWVANDACPPAPGCALNAPAMATAFPAPTRPFAQIWQYAQSPRRAQFSANCPKNAAADGNCYAQGLPQGAHAFVDLDVADSADPSGGR
jgi:Domain of unknown function (DUF1906)